MKKLLLSLIVGLLCAPLSLRAVTASDLDGMIVGQILKGGPAQGYRPVDSEGGKVTASGSSITISNFYGGFDISFVVSNTQLSWTINPYVDFNGYGLYSGDILTLYNAVDDYPEYSAFNKSGYYWYPFDFTMSSKTIYATIVSDSDTGGYRAEFSDPFLLETGNDTNGWEEYLFNGLILYFYPQNGTAVEDNNTSASYPVNMSWDSSKKLTLRNFQELGKSYNITGLNASSITDPKGSIDIKNKTVTIDYQIGQSYIPVVFGGYQTITLNWTSYSDYWIKRTPTPTIYNEYISSSKSSASPITGTYTGLNPRHTTDGQWNSNGGNNKTEIGGNIIISLGYQARYFGTNLSRSDLVYEANNTVINGNLNYIDVTHSVTLANIEISGTSSSLDVVGRISNKVNTDFVDHYEFYIKEGNITSISGQSLDGNTGLSGAVRIGNITAGISDTAFDGVFTDASMIAKIKDAGKATIFVKTVYKSTSGLAPTFHSLSPITPSISFEDMEDQATYYIPATAAHLTNTKNIGDKGDQHTFILTSVTSDNKVLSLTRNASNVSENDGFSTELTENVTAIQVFYGSDGNIRCDLERVIDFYLGHDANGYYFWCGESKEVGDKTVWTYYVLCTDLRKNSLFLMTKAQADADSHYDYHLDINFASPAGAPHRVAAGTADKDIPYVNINFASGNTLNMFEESNKYFAAGTDSGRRMALFVSPSNTPTTGVEDVEVGSSEAVYYDMLGNRVEQPTAGKLYIVRRGSNVTKEIYRN